MFLLEQVVTIPMLISNTEMDEDFNILRDLQKIYLFVCLIQIALEKSKGADFEDQLSCPFFSEPL